MSDRVHGLHRASSDVYAERQLLSKSQEDIVLDWCDHSSRQGKPLGKIDVRSLVNDIAGTLPGKNWHRRFEMRHPLLRLSKPSPLDPKRAQNFNKANITDYFENCKKVINGYSVPPDHMWNMDEKGIQMGGGRKNNALAVGMLSGNSKRHDASARVFS